MKHINLIVISCALLFSFEAQALECEVDYIAKKTEEDQRWFGTVKDAEIKSGTEEGKGATKTLCRDDALSKLTNDGWKITSEKTRLK